MSGDARAFARFAAGGSAVALALNVVQLMSRHWSLLDGRGLISGFYDAQGHALLHGHLAVPASAAGFEGFREGGATYIYQGPFPALLRLPLLALTHRYDGRLTPVSMLLALVVLLVAASVLHWRLRPPGAPYRAWAAIVPLAVGGSVVLFLTGWPVVYHEAELWGIAASVAALAALAGQRYAWAGVWATIAIQTRVSIALGPVAALAALAVIAALRREPRRRVIVLALAALVPLVTSVAVNEAKFARPFGIPIRDQVDSRVDPNRRAALAANGGTIFGAQFAPTQLLAMARPDAVGTTRAFPYVGVPADPPTDVGGARFDTLQRSLSATTSMPLLCVLCVIGLVALVRARRRRLLAIVVASAAGVAGALTIGYVTTRYLGDALPFLLAGALVGLYALRRWAVVPVLALALWGVYVNGSAGLVNGRLLTPGLSDADRAAFVRGQDRADAFLGRSPHGVLHGPALPARTLGRPADLFVVGRCAGLFTVGALGDWLPVERTPATGLVRLAVARDGLLLRLGAPDPIELRARRGALLLRHGAGAPATAAVPAGAIVTLTVDRLGAAASATVTANGRRVLSTLLAAPPHGMPLYGPAARRLPTPTPVCHRIARRAGLPQ